MSGKSKSLLSMPIISLDEGQQIGRVRGIVVDPSTFTVAALVTDKQGWFGDYKVVPFPSIMSIGEHAVTIDKRSSIEKPSNIPEVSKLIKNKQPLLGGKVFSETGTLLGIVEEFTFNTETGAVETLEISGRFIESLFRGKKSLPVSAVVTIGTDAIIVRTNPEQELGEIESPLKRRFGSIKSSSKNLFRSTKETTKKFGSSITTSIDKLTGDKDDELNEFESQKSEKDASSE